MEQTLISKKQLAARWNISTATVDRRVKEGKIKPATLHPIRFNMDDVLRAEGTDNSKLSPFERRRLERQIEELTTELKSEKQENERIKRSIRNIIADMAQMSREKTTNENTKPTIRR